MTTDHPPHTPPTPADPAQDDIPASRRFLARGTALGAGGALAGLSAAGPAAARSPTGPAGNANAILPAGFPAKNLGASRDALLPLAPSSEQVVMTPQPVYMLPRDHKFHAGQFYAKNPYWEWHFWSGFCQDAEGNDYALFFGTDPVGYDPLSGGFGFMPAVFSISPIKEGRNYHHFNNFPYFKARLPADSTSPADFQYLLRNDEAGWAIDERYYANDERWMFSMRSKNPMDPWCDLDIRLGAPGYIPRTPSGIEEAGFNDDGRSHPQTLHGLCFHYIAPNMPFTGTVGFGGRTVEVKGSVWLEHQWGYITGMDQQNCRWRWFNFRFDDGRMMALRHWVLPPDQLPAHERDHYCMVHPDGLIEYGFPNREMRFRPTRASAVPGVDDQWNPEGLMETPFGNFYLKALVEDSVFVSKTGMTFWEGPMAMLERDAMGRKIGMAYVEQYFQPRGGPTPMRTLPERDLARDMPIAGITPRRKR